MSSAPDNKEVLVVLASDGQKFPVLQTDIQL